MKGACFHHNLEFKLSVDGETWRQGDALRGQLIVKNRGAAPLVTKNVRVQLAGAALAQVKKKSPDAFEILTEATMPEVTIAPGAENRLDWAFETDRNCQIADGTRSPFLVYGDSSVPDKMGFLQLPFTPAAEIERLKHVLQIEFRFVLKTEKSSKGKLTVKLDPPGGKTYSSLELLAVTCWRDGSELKTSFSFHVNRIDPDSPTTALKKHELRFDRAFKIGGPIGFHLDQAFLDAIKGLLQEARLIHPHMP